MSTQGLGECGNKTMIPWPSPALANDHDYNLEHNLWHDLLLECYLNPTKSVFFIKFLADVQVMWGVNMYHLWVTGLGFHNYKCLSLPCWSYYTHLLMLELLNRLLCRYLAGCFYNIFKQGTSNFSYWGSRNFYVGHGLILYINL